MRFFSRTLYELQTDIFHVIALLQLLVQRHAAWQNAKQAQCMFLSPWRLANVEHESLLMVVTRQSQFHRSPVFLPPATPFRPFAAACSAAVDRADVRATLPFSIPNVVEWRLSFTTIERVAETDKSSQGFRNGDKLDAIVKPASAAKPAPEVMRGARASRSRWLRWRGLGRRGDSRNSNGNEGGGSKGIRRGEGKNGGYGAVRYVALLLPVGSGRTKVLLR